MIRTILATFGRYGTEGFALSIFLGLALPQFAAMARPVLPVTIFCFMVVVFLRADFTIIAGLVRRPAVLLASCLWLVAAPALLVLAIVSVLGRGSLDPGVLLGLAILGAAPPMMSAPAVAILYGFEPSLIIASVLSITILSPLIAPLMVDALAGQAVPLDASVLFMRLAIFVGGGMVVAFVLRRWLGRAKIIALKAEFDGFGVLIYFVFAVAAMDGATEAIINDPKFVIFALALVFGLALASLGLALVALRFARPSDRFMLGYSGAQRNMGLLVAALGAGVPTKTYLFFAMAQFPIYLLPWLLRSLAAMVGRQQAAQSGLQPASTIAGRD